jgi:hypothetical protein
LRWARLFKTYGGYSESRAYRHAADYELWCRWYTAGVRMANLPDPLYMYYQSDANFKAQNVRAILRDAVRIKVRYARELHFGVGDYLWLAFEAMASVLPTRAAVSAFYSVNRRRSTGLRAMAPTTAEPPHPKRDQTGKVDDVAGDFAAIDAGRGRGRLNGSPACGRRSTCCQCTRQWLRRSPGAPG